MPCFASPGARVRSRAALLLLCVALLTAVGLTRASLARAAVTPGTGATFVASDCSPQAAASDGTMVWNRMTPSGTFDAYIGNGDCQGSALLPAYAGNRGAADISSNGRYVLLVTAVGWDKSTAGAQPGSGSQNAIQLYDRQTGTLSTLLAGATSTQRGVIWPRFNADDTEIVWSQMVQTPVQAPPIGAWQLHVANVDLATGTLSDNRVWQQPGVASAIYEPYGWVPGTNNIIFMSTAGQTGSGDTKFQLFTLPDSLSGSATRISPPIAAYWPWEKTANAYHEFANFTPNDPDTLYTSIGTGGLGADLWSYDLDSASPSGLLAQPTRLTYFGGNFDAPMGQQAVAGFPTPAYSLVTSMAWVDGSWVASVCSNTQCRSPNAYRITLPASS
jgi:hypothetical protein